MYVIESDIKSLTKVLTHNIYKKDCIMQYYFRIILILGIVLMYDLLRYLDDNSTFCMFNIQVS